MVRKSILAGLAAVFGLVAGTLNASAADPGSPWGKDYMPNVPVVTQHGKTLRFYDDVIKDRIVVVSFIYTSCRDICPLVTARLTQVEEKLGDAAGRDVHFVSISIDPETDTPARLKEHAEAFHTGKDWLFLTGKKADIDQIRHKLGERSRSLTEHRNEVLLGNDRTGQWARDSAFSDLDLLTRNIKAMDPIWRNNPANTVANAKPQTVSTGASAPQLPGQTLFIKACAGCHTVGKGDRVGPDLAGLSKRRERSWIVSYMTQPHVMRQRQDPIAVELMAKYYPVRMPTLSLSEYDASDLIAYVEAMTYAAVASANGAPAHDHSAQQKNPHAGHGQHVHKH